MSARTFTIYAYDTGIISDLPMEGAEKIEVREVTEADRPTPARRHAEEMAEALRGVIGNLDVGFDEHGGWIPNNAIEKARAALTKLEEEKT